MTTSNNHPPKRPYISWTSPISSSTLTETSISLDELSITDSTTYWIEKRPNEAGRCVIVSHDGVINTDLITSPYSARSRVHEYGGGAYCCYEKTVYFVNDSDQDIYSVTSTTTPKRITCTPGIAYADLSYDAVNHRILCICEDHTLTTTEATNTIVSICIESGETATLCQGMDFYASPRLSHCGSRLAYLCWNHPDMP